MNLPNILGKGGDIHVTVGVGRTDEADALLREEALAILGAEVGVYDVQVCNTDLFPFPCKMQGIVDGDVCFTAAVMTCKKR